MVEDFIILVGMDYCIHKVCDKLKINTNSKAALIDRYLVNGRKRYYAEFQLGELILQDMSFLDLKVTYDHT